MPHSTCHSDPQLGLDIHTYTLPVSPTPIPLPTPHISIVLDPFDYLPVIGSNVYVNGMMRGAAGTGGIVVHIPIGGLWTPPLTISTGPQIDDEIFMGSKTVIANGEPMSRIAEPVLDCNIFGMIPPFRVKKPDSPFGLSLPLGINLAVSNGVNVGGPSTINVAAIAMKIVMPWVTKKLRSKMSKVGEAIKGKLFSGKTCKDSWLCRLFFGDPVDISNGSVLVEHQDFFLEGRIPLDWTRYYTSDTLPLPLTERACGAEWETPADTQLNYDPTQDITYFWQTQSCSVFLSFPEAAGREHAVTELVDGAILWLEQEANRNTLVVEMKSGLRHRFSYAALHSRPVEPLPIESISDLAGNRWEFERQGNRFLGLTEWDACGRKGRVIEARWHENRLTALYLLDDKNDAIALTHYHYDGDNRLIAEEDATGLSRRYTYRNGRMTSHTLRDGLSFYYEYNDQGRVHHSWGDDGLYDYHFVYNDLLNEVEVTDSLGNRTVVHFDASRLPICETDAQGNATRYTYDTVGRLLTRVDAARRKTRFEWDEAGNLTAVINPDHSTQTYQYRANRLQQETDEEGATRCYEWGERGELLCRTDALGHRTLYRYDDVGDLVYCMDPRGAQIQLSYDRYGFLRSYTDDGGRETRFRYDLRGLLLERTDASGRHIHCQYDAKGRLIKWCAEDGTVKTLAWDASDNPARFTDEQNGETLLSYSGMGVLTRCVTPAGHTLVREYDSEEQLVAVVNELGQRYRLVRDGVGRVIETRDYWGQQTQYRYDEAGNMVLRVDALGQRMECDYDAMGRLAEKRYQDGDKTHKERFRYDRCGRIIRLLNPWSEVTRQYDAAGQLLSEHQNGLGIYYRYNEVGICTGRKSDAGHRVEYGYDSNSQLTHLTLNERDTSRFAYDNTGQLQTETLSDMLSKQHRYDLRGRLVSQTLYNRDAALFSTDYRYDRGGNLTRRSDSRQGTEHFDYDPVGRLLSHTCPEGKITRFIQDVAGNQLQTRSFSHDDSPGGWWREGMLNGRHYLFDRAGNLRQTRRSEQDKCVFRWDGNQRLRGSHDGKNTVEYGYDAAGRRVFKRSQHTTTWFWWDGDALLGEVSKPNKAANLPDVSALDLEDTAAREQRRKAMLRLCKTGQEYVYWPGSFRPFALSARGGEQSYYYHNDPNGCPVRLTDGEGNIVWEAQYEAWGCVRQLKQQIYNPLRYQGQYFDDETGLHYNRYRYYNPECGAFVSQDPIGLAGGINLYRYVPNPLGWIDPLGLAGNPATATHITYLGIDASTGKPYVGYASMQGHQTAQDVLNYRYGGNFSRFGGQAPDILYADYGQSAKNVARGLEQRTFEQIEGITDGKRVDGSVWSRDTALSANKQNPVGQGNPNRGDYLKAADKHLNNKNGNGKKLGAC